MSYTFYNRAPEKNRAFAKKMNVFWEEREHPSTYSQAVFELVYRG